MDDAGIADNIVRLDSYQYATLSKWFIKSFNEFDLAVHMERIGMAAEKPYIVH